MSTSSAARAGAGGPHHGRAIRCFIYSRMPRANEAKILPKSSVMACPDEGSDELLSAPFHAAPSKWKLGKSKRSAG